MRTNAVPERRIGRGTSSVHTKAKRVAVFLDDAEFDLLRQRAVEQGVGMSAVVREMVDAGMVQLLPRS